MNTKTVLLVVAIIIIVYLIYSYYFSDNSTSLVSTQDARTLDIITGDNLPTGITADYTYSIWFYINDWNYRFGEDKVIFGRLDNNNDPAPSVTLGATTNDLSVTLGVYPNSTTNKGTNFTCSIKDIPLQRWSNLIMSLNNRALDLYLDGKLVKTCMLPGVPKMNPNSQLFVCPDGGFSGFISNFKYFPNAVNPSQAYDIYKAGYGGSSVLGSLFNKYRLKLAFVKDNKEVNSFEI
jgi:hypothetical protein